MWWIPVLARGKIHVELLPENYLGEKPEAVHEVVSKLPHILNVRFPHDSKPDVVMTDRGPAFYHAATGGITEEYQEALREHGLRALMGDDASKQSGDSQEVMLHETAVAWLRMRLTLTLPQKPCLETREEYQVRIKAQAEYINQHYDVEGLCKGFPERLQRLLANDGDRLRK